MSKHRIELKEQAAGKFNCGKIKGALIPSLGIDYLNLTHHNFDVVWNEETGSQDIVPADKWFGGEGEGSSFDCLADALFASLYDEYQVNDRMRDGDVFECEFEGETFRFRAAGVHVEQV